eukprot:Tamp_06280.p1 GENE.Tamp_06280~~Tamp_06280.p1  ORF type:complete len:321 (-),score=43.20 Tamp_06280:1790-2719(-)
MRSADDEGSEEEVRLAIEHLESGFMSRFTRFVMVPTNPFMAGACVLGSVVAAQTAYLQSTYTPLPPPARDVTCGYETYLGPHGPSSDLCRILVMGDSLVLSIGCHEKPVLAQAIARGLCDKSKVNVSWRSFAVDGGDVEGIGQCCLASVRAVVQGQDDSGTQHGSSAWWESSGVQAHPESRAAHAHPPSSLSPQDVRQRERAERRWRMGMHACSDEHEEHQELERHAATTQAAQAGSASGSRHAGRGADAADAGRARGTEEGPVGAGGGVKVDACVILCGLNDFKKVFLTKAFVRHALCVHFCACVGVL